MSGAEFAEWKAFYLADPWGPERDNWHAGIVAATAVRVAGGRAARSIREDDFVHRPWRSRPEDDGGAVESKIERFMAGF